MQRRVSEWRVDGVGGTREIAAQLAARLRPGATVALFGELGAGKTAFARALCRALGVGEVVHSPTFTLVHEHRGRMPVFHVDLYRVEQDADLASMGLDDARIAGGVVIVEWADRAEAWLPANAVRVELRHGATPSERRIRIEEPEETPE